MKLAQERFPQVDPTQLQTLIAATTNYQFFKACLNLSDLENDADAINAEMTADIAAVVAALPTAAEIDDTSRAIEFLKGFIPGHEKFFYNRDKETDEPVAIGFTSENYGVRLDDTEYAFFSPALKKILESEGGFKSAGKLIAEFADKGYLLTNKGRRDHAIKIGKKSVTVVHFKAGILARDAEEAEMEYYEQLGAFD